MISTPRSRCSASLFLEPEHNLGVMTIDASGKYVISPSVQAETPPANDSGPYASNDGGKTWASPHGLTMQTPYISSDRVQPKTFYAFSGGVWYVSTDGGFSYDAVDATKLGFTCAHRRCPRCECRQGRRDRASTGKQWSLLYYGLWEALKAHQPQGNSCRLDHRGCSCSWVCEAGTVYSRFHWSSEEEWL